jgi:hypothetical protein
MNDQLFKNIDYASDNQWVVKEFFNSVFQQGDFLWVLPLISKKIGCTINDDFCFFSNLNDPDPTYNFSGVMFGIMDDELTISEDDFFKYLRVACDLYLMEKPSDRLEVERILLESGIS